MVANLTLNQIAANARARRRELGLSQASLAERARVSRKWINEFEQGKSSAELGLVLRVCDALGLALAFVDDRSKARTVPTESTEASAQLPPADLMAALEESLARARAGRPTKSRQGWTQ